MKYCSKCASFIRRQKEFCYKCGNKLQDIDTKCICGYTFNLTDTFCESCGRKIPEEYHYLKQMKL